MDLRKRPYEFWKRQICEFFSEASFICWNFCMCRNWIAFKLNLNFISIHVNWFFDLSSHQLSRVYLLKKKDEKSFFSNKSNLKVWRKNWTFHFNLFQIMSSLFLMTDFFFFFFSKIRNFQHEKVACFFIKIVNFF